MSEYLFHTERPIRLLVEIGKGRVDIRAVDGLETRVDVTGRNADQVTVTQDGETVSVIAPRMRAGFLEGEPELDVQVSLPSASDVQARTGSADLLLAGALGHGRLRSGSGDVEVESMSGHLVVETGSGDVSLGSVGGDLRVKSGSGEVRVGRTESSSVVSTGSGDVMLDQSLGHTVVKTGSGDIAVEDAHTDVSITTGAGDLTVGTVHGGRLVANGASGDVRIGVPPGVPVWTDISSVTGNIRSDLVGAGQPEPGQDHIEIRAKSATGDIVLRQL